MEFVEDVGLVLLVEEPPNDEEEPVDPLAALEPEDVAPEPKVELEVEVGLEALLVLPDGVELMEVADPLIWDDWSD